ncbi:MAG: ribonuclease HI family protein [Candidatus Omnitrophica bacterium]|jgi:ribonuclease HI|nr:ribonuclease HI family protein [Candidatus Omnitrophota bacterium]
MSELEIYIDGASKGNPGPSGVGVVICHNGEIVKKISNYIGEATNNVAEYTALIHALQESLILRARKIKVYTDSELLYRQLKKVYRVKNENIQILYKQVEHLLTGFELFSINHVPRENNKEADKLATLAVKNALKKL